MKKTILITISVILVILISLLSTRSTVNADTKFSATLTTDKQTITNDMKEVTLYIKIGNFVSDGILGYEATLQYDENVFENVKMEGLNGWNNPSYDNSTKKFLSTSENAVGGTDIAKITLTLKDNLTAKNTTVAINDFTISDGSDNAETLNLQINYTIQNNENNEDSSSENVETPNDNQDKTEGNQSNTENTDNNEQNDEEEQTPNTDDSNNTETPNTNNPDNTEDSNTENSNENNTQTPNTNTNTTQTGNTTIIVGGATNEDITTAGGKIPQTGGVSTLVIIGIVSVIGIVCYIRYRTIQVK